MTNKPFKILLIIPPFSQINTPYPSIGQLAGYLKAYGYEVKTLDLSLKVALRIFSKEGLERIFSSIKKNGSTDEAVKRALNLSEQYISVIEPVIRFLQGKDPNLAYRMVKDGFLPQGEAFTQQTDELKAWGELGLQDRAKYYGSLVIDDITKIISGSVTPHFGLSRYAERIAVSPPVFDSIYFELNREPNIIEGIIIEETLKAALEYEPCLAGYTVPFPGNLLGALVSAKYLKKHNPEIKIALGGGYINTELRNLKDKRIFEYADFITYDDGELPLKNIVENLSGKTSLTGGRWVRTLMMGKNALEFKDDAEIKNLNHNDLYPPCLEGINPGDYISMIEMLNPMHRLWSDGYWNKLAVAHGCYWKKCTFCDITLDYIGRYSPAKASTVVDWMEDMIKQTGRTSFHFTDEAAPPSVLKEIALEILRRRLNISWWGNIRFEKSFTRDLCRLLAASGCIAVSGGLEVADERLLGLINKGVTLKQVASVCSSFQSAGIMVHAYLMYGFPTQTVQEIINSMELVRQFVKLELFQSGFWHLFTLTAHSPIAQRPDEFKIKILSAKDNPFANNDLVHEDLNGPDYTIYSKPLAKALYNYMQGIGLDWDVTKWFSFRVPRPTVERNLISRFLEEHPEENEDRTQLIWPGAMPEVTGNGKKASLTVNTNTLTGVWQTDKEIAEWILEAASRANVDGKEKFFFSEFKESFPLGGKSGFEGFRQNELWKDLRDNIILLI